MTPDQDELYLKVWVVGCHVLDSWATPPWWPEALETRQVIHNQELMSRVWGEDDPEERTEPENQALEYWRELPEKDEADLSAEIDMVLEHRDPSDMIQGSADHERQCTSVWVAGRFVLLKTHPEVDPDMVPWNPPWPAYQWEPRAKKYLVTTEGCDDKTHTVVELTQTELKVIERVSAAVNLRANGCRPYLRVKPIERASKYEIEEATETGEE